MKLKDERGRFFGLLNIIDIIILLILILGIALASILFFKNSKTGPGVTNRPISYTVEFQHLKEEVVANVNEDDKVFNSTTGAYLGVVKKVEITEQKAVVPNESAGVYEEHIIPDESTLYLTIEGNGYDNDINVVIEGQIIKIGKPLNVKGKGYGLPGYIVGIHLDESQE